MAFSGGCDEDLRGDLLTSSNLSAMSYTPLLSGNFSSETGNLEKARKSVELFSIFKVIRPVHLL